MTLKVFGSRCVMVAHPLTPWLMDTIEAIERTDGFMGDTSLEAFEPDWPETLVSFDLGMGYNREHG